MKALKALMERTDRVEIKGPGTELRFSIKGIPSVICGGDRNIPDGEVFSCPVKNSVQGHVSFNAPSIYQGIGFDGIRLEFRDGKIIDATSNQTEKLNKILDSDAGARYIGEFSLGFNPYVLEPMRDILFDEKIAGSFHFTPGQAYEEADNSNRSQVHWDMVNIQRPSYGGGEIYFDGKLIRRDGEFLPKQLRSLNRNHLVTRQKIVSYKLNAPPSARNPRFPANNLALQPASRPPRAVTQQIKLHHSDFAGARELQVCDLEHR